jgi:conjugal transfer/type IV secretion protein DotA/TraY
MDGVVRLHSRRLGWFALGVLVVLVLLFLPSLSFADTSVFTPVSDDLSVFYLCQLFGTDMLTSTYCSDSTTASQVIGQVFSTFNSGVMMLAVIIVTYTVVTGVLNTASEGNVMGQKTSSMWTPVRAAMGIGFLIPTSTGFCFLQKLLVYIIISGIGVADAVWSQASATLDTSMTTISSSTDSLTNDTAIKTALKPVFNGLYCMQATNYFNYGAYKSAPAVAVDDDTYTLDFGGDCGDMEWAVSEDATNTTSPETIPAALYDFINDHITTINSLVTGYLDNIQADGFSDAEMSTGASSTVDSLVSSYTTTMTNAVSVVSSDYITDQATTDADSDDVTKYGWVMVGSYYNTLLSSGTDSNFSVNAPTLAESPLTSISGYAPFNNDPVGTESAAAFGDMIGDSYDSLSDSSSDATSCDTLPSLPSASGTFSALTNSLFGSIRSAVNDGICTDDGSSIDFSKNWLMFYNGIGSDMIDYTVIAYWVLFALTGVLAAVAGISNSVSPAGVVFQSLLNVSLPVIFLIMGFFMATGAFLAVYLPIVPWMYFFFATMGWAFGVVETFAAAPIVSVALMHPEGGHDLWGKASPAIMLITNLFLRPSLLVMGFVVAAYLLNVLYALFNATFWSAAVPLASGMFSFICVLIVYVSVVLTVANKCFTLIYQLPDKVMQWCEGGGGAVLGAAMTEGISETQGKIDKGQSMAAGAASGAASAGQSGAEKLGDKMGQKMGGKAGAEIGGSAGGGGGGGGEGGGGEGGGGEGGGGEGGGGGAAGGGDSVSGGGAAESSAAESSPAESSGGGEKGGGASAGLLDLRKSGGDGGAGGGGG